MVLIHRWSLYAGSITWKVYLWGFVKCGLYKQVVFRAGLTVPVILIGMANVYGAKCSVTVACSLPPAPCPASIAESLYKTSRPVASVPPLW